MTNAEAVAPRPQLAAADHRLGLPLIIGAALLWSIGGVIARFISVADSWTIVFWRAGFAAAFLLAFMLWRDGPRGTLALIRNMGLPGLGVACCFGIASTSFVVALAHTTVANILLMQAGAPLIAALLAGALFGERVSAVTWAAIIAVIAGVAVMVSSSLTGAVSPVGDGLALLITALFATATVITRRHAEVRMTPAVFLGTAMAAIFSANLAGGLAVGGADLAWLFLFGAVNLGLGLALYVTGARLVPAAVATLVSTIEPVLAPVWVWLVHGEVPGGRTLLGGAIIFAALLFHFLAELRRQRMGLRP